jgi:hypothetical protein
VSTDKILTVQEALDSLDAVRGLIARLDSSIDGTLTVKEWDKMRILTEHISHYAARERRRRLVFLNARARR